MNNKIFITGGTGYIGSRIIPILINNNFEVTALVRKDPAGKLPSSCKIVTGNALDRTTYQDYVKGNDTFIHLIGVHHPGPGKKNEFRNIDLVSIEQAVPAAVNAGVKHFIYLSVAHPAPLMKEFINVRTEGEKLLSQSGMNATFVRPWYVLGPGHYWPYIILPFYKLFELIPTTRESALRLGLVTIQQMLACLLYSVKNPPDGIRVIEPQQIKRFSSLTGTIKILH